jgi:hypothetical protein
MHIEDLDERAFYSRKEIATLLRVTPQFVGQLEARGHLTALKIGVGVQPRRRYRGEVSEAVVI